MKIDALLIINMKTIPKININLIVISVLFLSISFSELIIDFLINSESTLCKISGASGPSSGGVVGVVGSSSVGGDGLVVIEPEA